MSTITEEEVRKVANLARLTIEDQHIHKHAQSLNNILDMIAHIDEKDTSGIAPMSSPFADTKPYLRDDEITEPNQRDAAQKLAANVEAGLYLVPKVIE